MVAAIYASEEGCRLRLAADAGTQVSPSPRARLGRARYIAAWLWGQLLAPAELSTPRSCPIPPHHHASRPLRDKQAINNQSHLLARAALLRSHRQPRRRPVARQAMPTKPQKMPKSFALGIGSAGSGAKASICARAPKTAASTSTSALRTTDGLTEKLKVGLRKEK